MLFSLPREAEMLWYFSNPCKSYTVFPSFSFKKYNHKNAVCCSMSEFVFGLQKNFRLVFSASTQPCCCAARLTWEYLKGEKKLLKGLKINKHGKIFHN